jgi:NAD(P)-dependent dehydrogenase (short-subunit alcohol dehydrogenase family)
MKSIENKIAIITGAGGGIGGAIADCFAHEGAKVVIADIDSQTATDRAARISAQGATALAVTADVTDKKSVQQMVQMTLERWGRIDILINVAGGAQIKNVIDVEESDWDYVIDMNLKSVFLCSQAVLPAMLKQRYGKIVSTSSIYGFTGNATRASYAAAKAGVAVFTKSLALEVVRDGINVNAIAPGRVATDRVRGHYTEAEWAERIAAIPMRRAAEPEEIAPTALFLVKDENSYITGQTIHVNGAWLNW